MGIEPTPSAWKAEVLPLNYTRMGHTKSSETPNKKVVEGEGFEPSKHDAADLQSAPFDRSGIPPTGKGGILIQSLCNVNSYI